MKIMKIQKRILHENEGSYSLNVVSSQINSLVKINRNIYKYR